MTRRLNVWLLSALLIIAIPYYWFLADSGTGSGADEARARPITITELRALAADIKGPQPVQLRVETVGMRLNSRNMLVAGGGMWPTSNAVRAYELITPGERPLVIDAGISRQAAGEHDFAHFNEAAQARVVRARRNAAHTILLADRPTHNGGHPPGALRTGRELPSTGNAPYALAPGVVVVPATGLAAGTNIVYARLTNGHEYLFVGDVAKLSVNWRELRLPARLATRSEHGAFRRENMSWLMTINELHRAAPQMTIVPGHEPTGIPFSAGTFSD